eukprot:995242-Amphidinium_carterae.1
MPREYGSNAKFRERMSNYIPLKGASRTSGGLRQISSNRERANLQESCSDKVGFRTRSSSVLLLGFQVTSWSHGPGASVGMREILMLACACVPGDPAGDGELRLFPLAIYSRDQTAQYSQATCGP